MIWKRVGRWPDTPQVRRDLVRFVDATRPPSPPQHPRRGYEQTLASVIEIRGSTGTIHGFSATVQGKAMRFFHTWREAKAWCDAEVALATLAEAA